MIGRWSYTAAPCGGRTGVNHILLLARLIVTHSSSMSAEMNARQRHVRMRDPPDSHDSQLQIRGGRREKEREREREREREIERKRKREREKREREREKERKSFVRACVRAYVHT
jgi:hypothetical protein